MGIFTKNYFPFLLCLLTGLESYAQTPAVIITSNAPLCAGTASLQLNETGGAAVSWSWSGPNTFSSTLQNPVIPNPTVAAAGLYSVTVTNVSGQIAVASLNVAINPVPDVNLITNQVLCNGALTLPVTFSGTVPGTQFSWTNTNDTIGLAASGSGNIAAFTAKNTKIVPVTALVAVTPQYAANGLTCTGTPQVFSYTVLPTPVVNAGPDIPICAGGNTTLSATGGVSCSWSPATGLSNAATCNPVASPSQNTFYTVTVTGSNGCTGTDGLTVNIHVPKPLTCNNLIILSLDQTGTAMITPDMILQGGTLDDAVFSINITTTTGVPVANPVGCGNIGQTLTVKVTDICNNLNCSGTLKVEDKLAPQLTCTNIDLSCAVTTYTPAFLKDSLGITAAYPVVLENCGAYTLKYLDTWNDLGCSGTFNGISDLSAYLVRKWTATDSHGNSSTCMQYIYFRRLHLSDLSMPAASPTVPCSNPDVSETKLGVPYYSQFGRQFPLYPNTSFCEMNAVYGDQLLPICDGSFQVKRTWTIYEWCLPTGPKNPLIYIQLINVADISGPQFVCPANLSVSTDPFTCCATVDLPDVILTDNCSRVNKFSAQIITYEYYTGVQTGSFDLAGTLTTFPGNNLWTPDTLGQMGNSACLPQGVHTVTYKALDDCGNTSSCSFQLTVADLVPPIASCDETTVVGIGGDDPADCYTPANGSSGAGVTYVPAANFNDGSFDNCNAVYFTVRRMAPYSGCIEGLSHDSCYGGLSEYQRAIAENDSIKFYCCEIGTSQTVILRVYQVDVNGNILNGPNGTPVYNECMVQVEVQDKIKPVCVPPANFTVSCEAFDPQLTLYSFATASDNCCLDTITHTANYSQFDTVCNRGTVVRTFRAFDCAGQSSSCTQRIVVDYAQNYFIKMPDDKIVLSCDGTGNYGIPTFFGEDCELLGYSYEDELFTVVPDACYKLERTWTIINWCTYNPNLGCTNVPNPNPSTTLNSPNNLRAPVLSPAGTLGPWAPTIVNLEPNSPTMTNFSEFWSPNANCYIYKQIIKILDNQDPVIDNCPSGPVEVCDLSPNTPDLWNDPIWYEVTTASHDLCEAPTDLSITAFDSCSGLNVTAHFLLFLDLDNDGTMETVVNSEDLPPVGIVNFGNALNPNFQGGSPRPFDQRNVPAGDKFRFSVLSGTNPAGTKMTFSLRFNTINAPTTYTIPELPYGTHRMEWIVEDGCGNFKTCKYNFTVRDCKAPTVVCTNGLSVNIMPTQMVQLWATDFLQYASDNCTPTSLLKYAVRRVGSGSGFPLLANGQPQTSVVFTCADLGMQQVELWAMDLAGNADYCVTFVLVQDNNANCPAAPAVVAGILATEASEGLEDATVNLIGSDPAASLFSYIELTDNDGHFAFDNAVPSGSNITVTPTKDDNPLNGVSTYDLVLISRHILGLEPITTPYRMIAADANKSGSITTFDIVELRKLILGIYQDLPANTSWRFVDKKYAFPNEANPFEGVFPENKSVANFQPSSTSFNFVAVKVGDVNGNAFANSFQTTEDRSSGTLLLDVLACEKKTTGGFVQAGEIFALTFSATEVVEGGQFTLQYPGLEVLGLEPDAPLRNDNFAIFNQEQALTTAWETNVPARFIVRFRALQSGELSQMLRISSRITRAEAYALATPDRLDVALQFHNNGEASVTGVGFELYQNEPNPFAGRTVLRFHLPEATAATLSVSDATGRVCWTQRGDFAAGYHRVVLEGAQLPASGLLYYQLDTPTGHTAGKMIRQEEGK